MTIQVHLSMNAMLAKLTPERFERIVPQLLALLGDGSFDTTRAVVDCITQCVAQTAIFHSMYANLVQALTEVPTLMDGVKTICFEKLATRREETRDDAKLAASFAAELCHRGLVSVQEMNGIMEGFGRGHVEVEVLCTLLTKLPYIPLKRST